MVTGLSSATLIVMLAGVTQDLKGYIGFISGMAIGKVGLNLFIGFGFGVIFRANPTLQTALTSASAIYMIWLAVKSWLSSVNALEIWPCGSSVKFRVRDGLILHPLNPKAWVVAVMAWGHFAPTSGDFSAQIPVVIFYFAFCQLIFHFLWCAWCIYRYEFCD